MVIIYYELPFLEAVLEIFNSRINGNELSV